MTEETPVTEVTALDAVVPEVESSTTPDEATETPPTDDAGTEKARDEKGRFVSPAQSRIDQLTYNWREQQRINERLMALLEEKQAPKPEPIPEAKPTLEQFGFDDGKYQEALIAYAERRAEAKVEEKLKAYEEGQKVKERQSSFQTRQADFAKSTEDYYEVAHNPAVPITANMAEDIAESEFGPQLAYYLGKNPDVARQIAALNPRAASRELGKIEARISAPKPAPTPSKAPPPPPKIAATDSTVSVKPTDPDSDSSMSDAEWFRAREKQIRRKS
jgi:hypothetical protein